MAENMKRIPLKNAFNVRDLGGYPTMDGKSMKWGVLYRSDALTALTETDWQILKERNVNTIIDLRSFSEADVAPVKPLEGMEYYHFSLMPELDQMKTDPRKMSAEQIVESMKLDYVKTLFQGIPCCVQILTTILERSERGSILFMCSAGKDRTGIVAAVLLYLCDTVREDIIADYMVSSTYNANGINKKLSSLPEEMLKMIPNMQLLKDCLDSKPETMIRLLDEMDVRDLRTLLAQAGFSAQDQKKLKASFTQ